MSTEPDNLVLVQLREMRRENAASMEAVATAMRNAQRIYDHFLRLHDDLVLIRAELSELRAESRKGMLQIESNIAHLESQNISRHGETISLMRQVSEIAMMQGAHTQG